jgi:spore maturation protein SpmA
MWLVIVLVTVMALWLVVTKPAESAAAIGHVASSIRLFITSF